MLKPRQIIGAKADGSLVSIALSQDTDAVRTQFEQIRSNGMAEIVEVELWGPWGREKTFKIAGHNREVKPTQDIRSKKGQSR